MIDLRSDDGSLVTDHLFPIPNVSQPTEKGVRLEVFAFERPRRATGQECDRIRRKVPRNGWVVPVGRLRTDVQMDDARTDLESIAEWLKREYPDTNVSQRTNEFGIRVALGTSPTEVSDLGPSQLRSALEIVAVRRRADPVASP